MARTLLVTDGSGDAHHWALEQRAAVVIDLSLDDPAFGLPASCALRTGGKVRHSRFVGSLNPLRDPIRLLQAAHYLAERAGEDAAMRLFDLRQGPLGRSIALAIAEAFCPDEVLYCGAEWLPELGWPGELVPLVLIEPPDPQTKSTRRRAAWIELLSDSEEDEIDLNEVRVMGTRLGSGHRVESDFEYAEDGGRALLIVDEREPSAHELSSLLHRHGCERAIMKSPNAYNGLICALYDPAGEQLGAGMIERMDWSLFTATVRCTSVPPSRAATLHIGALRIDPDGKELGEAPPWSL